MDDRDYEEIYEFMKNGVYRNKLASKSMKRGIRQKAEQNVLLHDHLHKVRNEVLL